MTESSWYQYDRGLDNKAEETIGHFFKRERPASTPRSDFDVKDPDREAEGIMYNVRISDTTFHCCCLNSLDVRFKLCANPDA